MLGVIIQKLNSLKVQNKNGFGNTQIKMAQETKDEKTTTNKRNLKVNFNAKSAMQQQVFFMRKASNQVLMPKL